MTGCIAVRAVVEANGLLCILNNWLSQRNGFHYCTTGFFDFLTGCIGKWFLKRFLCHIRKMYAITVFFWKFPRTRCCTSNFIHLYYTWSAVSLGLSILLVLRRSVRHVLFFEFCSIYLFTVIFTSISIRIYLIKDGLHNWRNSKIRWL